MRHPRPKVAEGLCYGQTDLPLLEAVSPTVAALQEALPAEIPCYTSPLQRCRRLAEQLHPAPVVDDRLMEMNFGRWEMQPWDEISRSDLDAWAQDSMGFCPPGGESVQQLRQRVLAFLQDKWDAPALLLVTHGGVMKVLVGLAHREAPAVWQARRFDYGGLIQLSLDQTLLNSEFGG